MKKWIVMSQKFRTSAHISYGKIRAHLAVYESTASKSQIVRLQSELGNKLILLIFSNIGSRKINQ